MAENRQVNKGAEFVLFPGKEHASAAFRLDDVVCFYPPKSEGGLTRIFIKEAHGKDVFDVTTPFKDVLRMMSKPTVVFNCYSGETNCERLGITVDNIAGLARQEDDSYTTVSLRQRTSADTWFYVTETPEEICGMIAEAQNTAPEMK